MKTLEQIDGEIVAHKEKITKWQHAVATKKADVMKLENTRVELRHKSFNGESRAATKLGDIRQAINVAQMEIEDLEAEAKDRSALIDALCAERQEAYRDKSRNEFGAASKLAITQAEAIEALLDQLIGITTPHTATLSLMNKLAAECGGQAHFRLRNLERRVEAKLSGHSVDKIYKEAYPVTLMSGIEGIMKQIAPRHDSEATEASQAQPILLTRKGPQ
jgi:hypothetical protein